MTTPVMRFQRIDGLSHRFVLGAGQPRIATFRDGREKADWLDGASSLDSIDPYVRALAQRITNGSLARADAARRLQRWVRDSIAYVPDPGGREEFADAATVARTGFDDCDGKARLFVALVRSLRDPDFQARIRPVFDHAGNFRHVQAEVRWRGVDWTLAELIVKGVGLGENPENARGPDGAYPMAGPRVKLTR